MMAQAKKTMYLYGRISVGERLRANPSTIRKLFLQERVSLDDIEKGTKAHGIPLERVSSHELSRIKPAKDLQGVVAQVERYRYAPYDRLLEEAEGQKRSLIYLDRIHDPHNLGAIIRTAACFGQFGVVIPQFNACGVTEAVLHVASGGENHIPVAMVPNLVAALLKAKAKGLWIMGAEWHEEAVDIEGASFSFPLGLVLGSEGEGIRYGIQKHLDVKVRIPMRGAALSLNVSVASAILCYEIAKQRRGEG
jgi:23S rRNA (guanosine2251-2'-O)-methyltransferase